MSLTSDAASLQTDLQNATLHIAAVNADIASAKGGSASTNKRSGMSEQALVGAGIHADIASLNARLTAFVNLGTSLDAAS
jgi:hypothetical protein